MRAVTACRQAARFGGRVLAAVDALQPRWAEGEGADFRQQWERGRRSTSRAARRPFLREGARWLPLP
jgi:hypothetical protein